MKLWLNGDLVAAEAARVSPFDHGLLLGDGVFETLRCYGGVPFALDEHLERLALGARTLGLEPPGGGELSRAVASVVEANRLVEARVRITVTSGSGPSGLARGDEPPTVLISAVELRPWPPHASAIVSRFRRDETSPLAGVKTISLVDNVLAAAQAREQGADEALFLNSVGDVCEATTANVFAVRAGVVETPSLSSGCLAGITRGHLIDLCHRLGVEVRETSLPLDAVRNAEELFLTSSTREAQPLVHLDGEPVGDGAPGAVTQRLAEAFAAYVRERR